MAPAPPLRVTLANAQPLRPDRDYILYWMIAQRRTGASFALQHALHHAAELRKPLLVLEALRADYPWASDRLHRFVIDGMADNAKAFAAAGVRYHGYVEPARGAGKGLLAALAARACAVVTDEFPCFFLPRMVARAGRALDVRLEQVDGNGLLPLRAYAKAQPSAYAFRRVLQKSLPEHLAAFPDPEPLRAVPRDARVVIPRAVLQRWPEVPGAVLAGDDRGFLAKLPIDHDVRPTETRGGSRAAHAVLARFLDARLRRYGEERNQPEADATSGLSPYLHFGHVSVHEVFAALATRERWTPARLALTASGAKAGWWGTSAEAESFLDELVTWRELGYGFCHARPDDYDEYASLPPWALATLEAHRGDPRPHLYDEATLARGSTHDPLWNAAQRQLVREGCIPGYLRMLWGKKILEWTRDPEVALATMIELNNRYALDGRDPNSYSGIFWTLGRFDRPWPPERPVFGVVRYMSSANTARKLRVKGYVALQAPDAG